MFSVGQSERGFIPIIAISVDIVWTLNHLDKGNKKYVFITRQKPVWRTWQQRN